MKNGNNNTKAWRSTFKPTRQKIANIRSLIIFRGSWTMCLDRLDNDFTAECNINQHLWISQWRIIIFILKITRPKLDMESARDTSEVLNRELNFDDKFRKHWYAISDIGPPSWRIHHRYSWETSKHFMHASFSISSSGGIPRRNPTAARMNAIGALYEPHAHMSELSDNERHWLKAEETNGVKKRKGDATSRSPSRSQHSYKYLMNGRQSVSLFKRLAMTDLYLRAGGTSANWQ